MNKKENINLEVGAILRRAVEKFPKTQQFIADAVKISTKQLQNYCNGQFPVYKGNKIKELDNLLGTHTYELLYEKNILKESTANEDLSASNSPPHCFISRLSIDFQRFKQVTQIGSSRLLSRFYVIALLRNKTLPLQLRSFP